MKSQKKCINMVLLSFLFQLLMLGGIWGMVVETKAASSDTIPVAHWEFDEENGNVASDASGLGNTASLVNGPVWESGKVEGSLHFDGVNDYVDAGNNAFGLTDEVTTALWVKPAVIQNCLTQVLIQRGRYVYPFMMRIESKRIRACIRTTTGTHYLFGQSMLVPDQWYHVALTFAGGEMILYMDGKEESRLSVSGQMNVMANQKTTLGANPLGPNPFAGNLDDVRIYDRALGLEEITMLSMMQGDEKPMSITQNGITWTLDRAYQVGQFANGDYWVVGPANIIAITNNYHVHGFTPLQGQDGSMINPGTNTKQGYDKSLSSYDAILNVSYPNGYPISASNPLLLDTNQTLISAVSWLYRSATDTEPGCPTFNATTQTTRPVIRAASVLTCLTEAAASGSFRPPYVGTDKSVRFNVDQLQSNQLENLGTSGLSSIPAVESMENDFARVWLDHVNDYLGSYVHPSEHMDHYGREIAKKIGDAALMLNLNFAELPGNPTKDKLLMEFVQLGIDLAGIADNGGFWRPNGGFNQGRKWPILFAGLMLNDAHMQGVGTWSTLFQEDGNTFYVSQADVDRTHSPQWNPDDRNNSEPYETSDIGLPEWGIRHATDPYMDDKDWNAVYRATTTCSYPGFVLAAHIMGQKQAWNHDPLFDFVDRWMGITGGAQQHQTVTPFTMSMWNKYRTIYPPVWSE
ncbi:MAG: LamG domain-containing protein [Desulfamplus sp.]|nr:LamG domain-containing protein [Desulfamplus sp.]